jgi:hypothetical protein
MVVAPWFPRETRETRAHNMLWSISDNSRHISKKNFPRNTREIARSYVKAIDLYG